MPAGPANQAVDIKENIEMLRAVHIEETIASMAPAIFSHLEIAGFFIPEDDDMYKDGTMIIESIRSLMLKLYGESHPFQKIAEEIFQIDEKTGDVGFVKDSIIIDLKIEND